MIPEKSAETFNSLYTYILHLLSGYNEDLVSRIDQTIEDCVARGICDDELALELQRLKDDIVSFVRGEIGTEEVLLRLKQYLASESPISELAVMIVREVCSGGDVELVRSWGDELEPAIRIGAIKCLSKLYDEGKISLDYLAEFSKDPSPKVREALVSSLEKHVEREEVASLLSSMLGRETRSSIRTKILTALSRTVEHEPSRRRGGLLRRFKRIFNRID